MSVHQTKDGRWYVKYPDKRKKGGYAKKYFGRGNAAHGAALTHNQELGLRPPGRPRSPGKGTPRFVAIANAYLEAKYAHLEASSMDALVPKLKGVIIPALGHLRAGNITHDRMDAYVKKRLSDPVTIPIRYGPGRTLVKKKILTHPDGSSKTISRTTICREIDDIKAILSWAASRRPPLLMFNPLDGYKKPKRDSVDVAPPSVEEANLIITAAADHLKRALALSWYTGVRPGRELLGIEWDDIDLKGATVFVRSAMKGGASHRMIPLVQDFIPTLRRWRLQDQKKNLTHVITWRGKPVRSISRSFAAAKKRAGIGRRLRPYDLRHAFATHILAGGGDLKPTSYALGHTRTDTTTRHYQHINIDNVRDAVEKMPRLKLIK